MNVRFVVVVVALVAAWCALWEAVSFANIASGLILAIPAVMFAGSQANGRSIRFVALSQLVLLVAVDLVKSTVNVVWEILTPTDFTDETIIAIDSQVEARSHLLLLVVAITLTPGTAVVDTDPDTGRLYVHLLHADAEAEVTEHVRKLARLACRAFPGTDTDPSIDRDADPDTDRTATETSNQTGAPSHDR